MEINLGLIHVHTKRLDRGKYLALIIAVLLAFAGFFGLFITVTRGVYSDPVSNILYPLTSFVGAGWTFLTAMRAYRGPWRLGSRQALAWSLIGMALLANCCGGLYFTYLAQTGQAVLVPSLSDIGFTLFYPLLFTGLFFLPTNRRFRLSIVLDALIATLCMLGISWFFFIGKIFAIQIANGASLPKLITIISYPFWDILLLFAIFLLIYRRTQVLSPVALVLLAIGMLANIWADTGYAYTTAIGMYDMVSFFIDPFWYVGFLSIGLASLYHYAARGRHIYYASSQTEGEQLHIYHNQPDTEAGLMLQRRLIQQALVYLPLIVLLVLTCYDDFLESFDKGRNSFFLITLTMLVGILVALRSLLVTRENEQLLLMLARARTKQEIIAVEQTKLYAELRLAHERLQELDKLKDQFMLTASHELRTPLTAIQGYLELLLTYSDTLDAELRRDFLEKAFHGSEELMLLFNNVMDATRLEIDAGIRPAHLQTVDIGEAIYDVLVLLEPQTTKENRQIEKCVPSRLSVQADPLRLRQVLLNITANAIKYSPAGSPLKFSVSLRNEPVPSALIQVIDQGKGIEPQDQERLFQRFVRLDRDINSATRGSGLGLYISRRLIEAMGGKIWVESSGIPGEGSCFSIQL
ncbi:MAG TPA: HAMP domain-containing sensor histidine kinase, partial [Ktedonobacteraceae bacterium]|nr:HAMP domain-containing sensor histidine kinase [Ktedonobacteraceae bacterium]